MGDTPKLATMKVRLMDAALAMQIVENTMSGGTTPGTGVVAIAGMGAWVDTAATTPKRL